MLMKQKLEGFSPCKVSSFCYPSRAVMETEKGLVPPQSEA